MINARIYTYILHIFICILILVNAILYDSFLKGTPRLPDAPNFGQEARAAAEEFVESSVARGSRGSAGRMGSGEPCKS